MFERLTKKQLDQRDRQDKRMIAVQRDAEAEARDRMKEGNERIVDGDVLPPEEEPDVY